MCVYTRKPPWRLGVGLPSRGRGQGERGRQQRVLASLHDAGHGGSLARRPWGLGGTWLFRAGTSVPRRPRPEIPTTDAWACLGLPRFRGENETGPPPAPHAPSGARRSPVSMGSLPAGCPLRGTPPRFRLDEPQSPSPGTSNWMQMDSQQSAGPCPGLPASRGWLLVSAQSPPPSAGISAP